MNSLCVIRAGYIRRRILLCAAIAFAAAVSVFPGRTFAMEVFEGSLADLSGSVEVRKRGTTIWVEAEDGMVVSPGDLISTGIDGRAVMRFKNSETKIFPLTEFAVGRSIGKDTEIYTELFLLSGKVSSHVFKTKKTGIKNKFQVITPTAVVGVRGTVQTVEYNPAMGTSANIKDGKGFSSPLPKDKFPPAVLELLGIAPADTSAAKKDAVGKESPRK